MVQLHAALQPAPRDHRGHGDQQLVLLARRQVHALSPQHSQTRGSGRPSRSTCQCRHDRARAALHRRRPAMRATSMPSQALAPASAASASAVAHRSQPRLGIRRDMHQRRDRARAAARSPARCSSAPTSPSSRIASCSSSRPPRRTSDQIAQPRRLARVSPIAARPNTRLSTPRNQASRARSTSSRRSQRAAVEQDRLLRQPFRRRAGCHRDARAHARRRAARQAR